MRILALLLLLLFTFPSYSQEKTEVNADDFIQAIQKTYESGDTMKMVFWFPTEFWDIVNRDSPDYDTAGVKLLETIVEDYIIFAVVDGYFSIDGGRFKTDAELRKTISLVDKDKKVYLPLSDLQVSKTLDHIMSSMKPLLSNMLGNVGKGFNFYYFKVKDANNQNLIQARQKGEFTVQVGHKSFKWNLPLSAYLPAKICPVDKQKMNMEWSYCPFHGNKIVQ